MNQQKMGGLLKQLRKERIMTQEQLAEEFGVSVRTVSRWETGSSMPDVEVLIELADYYGVDIREMIDGERKNEDAADENKDTLRKVAAYAAEERMHKYAKLRKMGVLMLCAAIFCYGLLNSGEAGLLYGVIPEGVCTGILAAVYYTAIGMCMVYLLLGGDIAGELVRYKQRRAQRKRKTKQ